MWLLLIMKSTYTHFKRNQIKEYEIEKSETSQIYSSSHTYNNIVT